MNKSDLIETIATSACISKACAERGLNGLLNMMSSAMKEGERVSLAGFGSFTVVDRAPRTGRNPKTGEVVPIPSRKAVRFRPGKHLSRKLS